MDPPGLFVLGRAPKTGPWKSTKDRPLEEHQRQAGVRSAHNGASVPAAIVAQAVQPRLLPQPSQDIQVMPFQLISIQPQQPRPIECRRDGAGFAWHAAILMVHLEEQQGVQLLNVVAVLHAIIPQDVAVVPLALDDSGRWIGHWVSGLIRLGSAEGCIWSSCQRSGFVSM